VCGRGLTHPGTGNRSFDGSGSYTWGHRYHIAGFGCETGLVLVLYVAGILPLLGQRACRTSHQNIRGKIHYLPRLDQSNVPWTHT